MATKDTIYRKPLTTVKDFVFDAEVVTVFDDMIGRSVPLYFEAQKATARLAAELLPPGGVVYDLGCSTGATIIELWPLLKDRSVEIVGIDESTEMLARCREKLNAKQIGNVILRQEDITQTKFERASAVILNYTLQFVDPQKRLELLSRCVEGMLPGGVLLLSEKLRQIDSSLQKVVTDLHHDFKRLNGYSELEIAQKREALENVLIPLTIDENAELLRQAGFRKVELILKWYSFGSFVAFK